MKVRFLLSICFAFLLLLALLCVFSWSYNTFSVLGSVLPLFFLSFIVVIAFFVFVLPKDEAENNDFDHENAKDSAAPAQQVEQVSSVSPSGVADELAKLAQLKDAGILTEEEFNAQKAKLLNS